MFIVMVHQGFKSDEPSLHYSQQKVDISNGQLETYRKEVAESLVPQGRQDMGMKQYGGEWFGVSPPEEAHGPRLQLEDSC